MTNKEDDEEDDEAEGSRRSLPTKQIKISIQLSFHDIVLYSVDVLCMIECCINDSILLIFM